MRLVSVIANCCSGVVVLQPMYRRGLSVMTKLQVFACSKFQILCLCWISHQCNIGSTAVTLTSTLGERQAACPGEVVTYTCTALHTAVISWVALPDVDVDYFPNSPLGQQIIGDFRISLTNRVSDPNNPTTLADLTITLTANTTLARNGTVVQCRGDDPSKRMSLHLIVASQPPSPPQNPGYHVQHYGPHNVTVTVQWGYPEFDGGVPVDSYTISGSNIMTTTSQINETTLTLPYNANQTIEIAASNCIGTSRTERIEMSAMCNNMAWRPDLAILDCRELADCGAPPPPMNGSLLQLYTNTTEGSVVMFQCDLGFVPEGEMTALCGGNGQWVPNPGGVTCSPRPTPTSTQTTTQAPIQAPTQAPTQASTRAPTQAPTQASTLTNTSTPTGYDSTQMSPMQPWLLPVLAVCACVLSCAIIIIIITVGIVILKRRHLSHNLKKHEIEMQPNQEYETISLSRPSNLKKHEIEMQPNHDYDTISLSCPSNLKKHEIETQSNQEYATVSLACPSRSVTQVPTEPCPAYGIVI